MKLALSEAELLTATGASGTEIEVTTGATFCSATRKGEKLVVVPQIVWR